jgi:hypothetical protein
MEYCIDMTCTADATEVMATLSITAFRARKLYTNVSGPGLATVAGIYMGGMTESLIVGPPIDAWEFGIHNKKEMIDHFMVEHGLTGKSERAIQRYMDLNGLSLPSVPRLDLPAVRLGESMRITGRFPARFVVTLLGDAIVGC